MKILVTGSQGFIGSYICNELLEQGHTVIGIDNFSKYGKLSRPHDSNSNFTLLTEDITKWEPHPEVFRNIDVIVAGAAMIGGICYFHKYAYDLLATNERILANTFDLALKLHKEYNLKRIVVLSSSMVFENTNVYPTSELEIYNTPPPACTYGFQKLASEYFAKGAWEQYQLPYSIVRPFNCVGVGEESAIGESLVTSGNVKLMMSHVLPDLINKILQGQDPLHILGSGGQVRCYTHGKDTARGIRMIIESDKAINEDFNISVSRSTSVLELAQIIWKQINGNKPFNYVSDEPMIYDVQKRIPDVTKAKDILGFEANISLEDSVDEVIQYIKK